MAAPNINEIVKIIPLLSEEDSWRLFAELSKRMTNNGPKISARDLLGTLKPASPVDPQERVRRLRDEWEK